jgi:hypothetical protein
MLTQTIHDRAATVGNRTLRRVPFRDPRFVILEVSTDPVLTPPRTVRRPQLFARARDNGVAAA